jgi:hypothetical protein
MDSVRTRVIRLLSFRRIRRLFSGREKPPNGQEKKPPVINHTPWIHGKSWTK